MKSKNCTYLVQKYFSVFSGWSTREIQELKYIVEIQEKLVELKYKSIWITYSNKGSQNPFLSLLSEFRKMQYFPNGTDALLLDFWKDPSLQEFDWAQCELW